MTSDLDYYKELTRNSDITEILRKHFFPNNRFHSYVYDEEKKVQEHLIFPYDLGGLISTEEQLTLISERAIIAVHDSLQIPLERRIDVPIVFHNHFGADLIKSIFQVATFGTLSTLGISKYIQLVLSDTAPWYLDATIPIALLYFLGQALEGVGEIIENFRFNGAYNAQKHKIKIVRSIPTIKALRGVAHEYIHAYNNRRSMLRNFRFLFPSIIKEGLADYGMAQASLYQGDKENNPTFQHLFNNQRVHSFRYVKELLEKQDTFPPKNKKNLGVYNYTTTPECYYLGYVLVDFLAAPEQGGIE